MVGRGRGHVNEGEKHGFHWRRTFCGEIISRVEIRVSGHHSEHDTVDPEVKDKSKKGPKRQQMHGLHQNFDSKVPNDTCLGSLDDTQESGLTAVSASCTDG